MVLEILETLSRISKKTEKLAILKSYKDNDTLKVALKYALDPSITFFMKRVPKPEKHTGDLSLEQGLDFAVAGLSSRKYTGNEAQAMTKTTLELMLHEDAVVLDKVIRKKLDCGISADTVNKVWPDLIRQYKVMLAQPDDVKNMQKINYPAMSQTKCDGMRVNIWVQDNKVTIYSRRGQVLETHNLLDTDFQYLAKPLDLIFDGEALVVDDEGRVLDRKTGNGILNKAIKQTITKEDAAKIRFVLWDMITPQEYYECISKVPYSERLRKLQYHIDNFDLMLSDDSVRPFKLIDTKIVNDYTEARDHFQELYDLGYEGTVLKNSDHPWVNKRSKDQVKLKAELDCDLKIVGTFEGEMTIKCPETGQPKKLTENVLGGLICESADGKVVVNVGSGLSQHQRLDLWARREEILGQIIEVRYNERISSRGRDTDSLFLPRLIEFRLDKTEADASNKIS